MTDREALEQMLMLLETQALQGQQFAAAVDRLKRKMRRPNVDQNAVTPAEGTKRNKPGQNSTG
jgi:hypothetical protein